MRRTKTQKQPRHSPTTASSSATSLAVLSTIISYLFRRNTPLRRGAQPTISCLPPSLSPKCHAHTKRWHRHHFNLPHKSLVSLSHALLPRAPYPEKNSPPKADERECSLASLLPQQGFCAQIGRGFAARKKINRGVPEGPAPGARCAPSLPPHPPLSGSADGVADASAHGHDYTLSRRESGVADPSAYAHA